ncbi:lipase secretion chaperone [Turneriella parva]|uniref:Lipase helper protein n=1 Tax=Turneriella parva (strain ATCC BAA-1111 / DSM 21527 / NCTC 11395 / H) TaxID=869212 RepID=I4B2A4_TURPD|nr:lipase secretion chaperone [Turneriella parva]AFM11411.1 hypothetical protein Turpa_0760 [Turneriella parva DSM 21527]
MEILKRYRWPLLMVVVALLGYRLFFHDPAGKANMAAVGIERFPYPTDRLQESQGEYLLKEIQEGRIDLPLELVRLRRDCAGELDETACHEKIRQLIQDLPGKDKGRLLELFEQYLQFEEKMRQNLPANFAQLSNQEKYKLMKKARREFFGEANANLIFGLEEARIALQEEQNKFGSFEYTNLPADERMRLYSERKKEILGPYFQATLEREPPDIKYGTELMLVQTDISRLPEVERARVLGELRVKHFGPVEAQRLEQQEKQALQADAESLAKMDRFLAAEKEYLRNNPAKSDSERQAAIEELRRKYLGQP